MTIIFLPDGTSGNPYQRNLADALDEEVAFAGVRGFFPILRVVWSHDDVSTIHFHWLEAYIQVNSSALKTFALLIVTIIQLVILRLKCIRMVWTVHNVLSHESRYPWLERWFKKAFIRFGFCDHLFVHCEAVVDSIITEYNLSEDVLNKVQVIPHGHYLDNYENEIPKEEARSELGLKHYETIFLFFGQIRPYKGVQTLIDEFKSVETPNSRLLVVGSPMNESIEKTVLEKSAADDRVTTVLDFIPDEDIQLYMNASDCVVLPYNEITTSGSAALALSFGKAIIIPRRGCVPEQLDEEGSLIYSTDTVNALRTALTESLNRDLVSMGKHNEQLARQYDWKVIAEMTSQVYI
jgi:glycosyltransferase involved in cell wall biosynthesis